MDKIYSFLGLAAKARKVVIGENLVEKSLKTNKVQIVILALDSTYNTQKKIIDKCTYRGVDVRRCGEKSLIGKCIGKKNEVAVVAILDKNFAKGLVNLLDRYEKQNGGEAIG